MTTVKVNASVSYDVIIGRGLLDRCGELSASVVTPSRACIVTDDNVAPLYLQRAETSLKAAGFDTVSFVLTIFLPWSISAVSVPPFAFTKRMWQQKRNMK